MEHLIVCVHTNNSLLKIFNKSDCWEDSCNNHKTTTEQKTTQILNILNSLLFLLKDNQMKEGRNHKTNSCKHKTTHYC